MIFKLCNLYDEACKYFCEYSGLNRQISQMRKNKTQDKMNIVWEEIKNGYMKVSYKEIYSSDFVNHMLNKEWIESYEISKYSTINGYVYYIEVEDFDEKQTSTVLEYTKELWISAFISVGKQFVENEIANINKKCICSLAPGVDGVPISMIEKWAEYIDDDILYKESSENAESICKLKHRNSLLAMMITN